MNDVQQRLGDLLLTVPALHDRMLQLGTLGQTSASAAIADLGLPHGDLVRAGATAAVNSSIDHLLSWAGLYIRAGILPSFAHFTLLRSTVEAASTARWLVAQDVDQRVRVARGIGHQLMDLEERRKIEEMGRPANLADTPFPFPDAMTAAQRIEQLTTDSASAGLTPIRMARIDLVGQFGPGAFVYRMLCAFAHAGQAVPFAMSSREAPLESDAGGLRRVMLTGSAEMAHLLSTAGIKVARQALIDVYSYSGHTLPPDDLRGARPM